MAQSLEAARAALRSRQGSGARYDAGNAPARELDWARRGTAYFARLLNEIGDAEFDKPSVLPMVSRRHIIAHIGYHARLLSKIVGWVRSNRDGHLPFNAEVDLEDVRQQATLPARALRNLFVHSGVHLDVEWRDLSDAQWDTSAQDRNGQPIAIRETPCRRARAIWLHAMDLGAGGRFEDMPPDLVDSLIREVAGRKSQTADCAFSFTDRGKLVTISNDAGITVSGPAGDVVRWLYGRGAARNLRHSGGALPNDLALHPNLIGVRPNPLDF